MKKKMFKKLLSVSIMLLLAIIPVSCSYQATFMEDNQEKSPENSPGSSTVNSIGESILLPASINTIDGQKWGYINDKAEFKIKPEYDGVEEFNKAGIAIVFNYSNKEKRYSNDKNIFIINKSGKKLSGPIKCSNYLTTEQNIIIIENGKSKFINKEGVVCVNMNENKISIKNSKILNHLLHR